MILRTASDIRSGLAQKFLAKPYHCLNIISDSAQWVLDYEGNALSKIAKGQGIPAQVFSSYQFFTKQCVHFTSQFFLFKDILGRGNRISIDYYHGMPNTESVFNDLYEAFKKKKEGLARVRVSQSQIEDLLKNTGIDQKKIFRIPIGVDDTIFSKPSRVERNNIRRKLGIPESAVVIGSFQKDGSGWGDGMEAKFVKGPDVFLKVIEALKGKVDGLFILLTGPARGFVKQGLDRLGVPYVHHYIDRYEDIAQYYQAIDLYLVASREEGGPKAILESMAAHVPLVTTRVGQARDLVHHEQNGWMVESEDVEGLVHWSMYALSQGTSLDGILRNGRKTAEANSYREQVPLWQNFFEGFLDKD